MTRTADIVRKHYETRLQELTIKRDESEKRLETLRDAAMASHATYAALTPWRREREKLKALQVEIDELKAELHSEQEAEKPPLPDGLRAALEIGRAKATKLKNVAMNTGSERDRIGATRAAKELRSVERKAEAFSQDD